MAAPKPPPELSDALLEEATAWLVDCNEGELDAAGRERFLEWLRRSPEHVRAYVEVAAAWEDSGALGLPPSAEIEALVARTRAEQNVVELVAPRPGTAVVDAVEPPLRWARASLAAAVAVMALGAGYWYLAIRGTYETGIGEQRSIVLEDGSTIALNARSKVRVRYGEAERDVDLLAGQALFVVHKDSARPFVVRSDGTRVRAVGTQFDVYRKSARTTVTVIEGQVAVVSALRDASDQAPQTPVLPDQRGTIALPARPVDDKAGEVLLVAGQQLTIEPLVVPQPTRVDVAAVTAWTQRKLVFDEASLAEAVEEFNRYNTRQIVLEDPELAQFHIRGSFQATDPDRLVRFLQDRFGVHVRKEDGEIRVSRH